VKLPITVACAQFAPRIGEVAANRDKTVDLIDQACSRGASLVVLPELANCGYVFESADEARSCGEDQHGPTVRAWAEVARQHDAVVVGGYAEAAAGRLYNSAAIVTGNGAVATYRKLHLWGFEKLFFSPGDRPPPVVETVVGRIGVGICYDLWFPEIGRALAVAGADIMCLPTNWPTERVPPGEKPMELRLAMVTANVNRMAVACADRCGTERGIDFLGWSVIIDARGWPAVEPGGDSETLVSAALDLAESRDKRYGEYNDVMGDRRPEFYGQMTTLPRGRVPLGLVPPHK
jgi:predicted amidohydrolase